MRITVTGAAGFIGRHTVMALEALGHLVTGLDLKLGHDLSEPEAGLEFFDSPDLIIHLASSVSTPRSVDHPVETFRDTVCTAATVLEAARPDRIPVLVVSSVKARDARTPYGAAKRMVEIWATEHHKAYHIPVLIDRPGTVYGPGQEGSRESGWVAWFLEAKAKGIAVTIDGSGTQIRDLLYVSDLVDLFVKQIDDLSLGRARWNADIWDVGGGEKNVVSVLGMAMFLNLERQFGPPRYGDVQAYVGVNDYPGWKPEVYWKDSGVFKVR